jgi:uncharacterized membrane protein YcaP (DUF421 family)
MSPPEFFVWIFGGDEPRNPLAWGQVAMRAIAIYIISIALVRWGKSRMISRVSSLDVIFAFILGSLLSRGITGSASISNTTVASAALIAGHSFLTWLSCRSPRVENLIKGHCRAIISDGVVLEANLRKSHLSEADLGEELRLNANCDDISQVKAAYKERSGEISVIRQKVSLKVVEVDLKEEAKKIRIEIMSP